MPVAYKALIVILVIGLTVFAVARPVFSPLVGSRVFLRWRNAWVATVVAGFVVPNIWGAFCLAGFVAWYAGRDNESQPALFLFLMLALPGISVEIPGFGLARFLFSLDYVRLLILVLLVPAAIQLHSQKGGEKLGSTGIDRILLAYLLLDWLLYLPFSSITNNIRKAFLIGLDVIIPYFVFSRSLRSRDSFIKSLAGFSLGVSLTAMVAVFEGIRKWPVYSDLQTAWGVKWSLMEFILRDDLLRAQSSTGHPLVLGYVCVVALGCWFYVGRNITSRVHVWLGYLAIAGGLAAALSRGPWLGAIVALLLYALMSPKPMLGLMRVLLPALFAGAAIMTSPWSGKLINLLPFVGQVDAGNVTYRRLLLEYSLEILRHSPFLGNPGFMAFLEDLRQGQGIIDIVNSYLAIALRTGMVGLSLFVLAFVWALKDLWKVHRIVGRDSDSGALVRTVFSILVSVLIMISSVSGISVIPYVYWSFLGIAAALCSFLSATMEHPVDVASGESSSVQRQMASA